MAEILPMRRITLINQSINQSIIQSINQSMIDLYSWKKIAKVIITVYSTTNVQQS